MSTSLTKAQPQSVEASSTTPMRLIEIAVQGGADVEKLSKLLDLQMRWEANEARKVFIAAMNEFKANPPEIIKNRHVKFGSTEYDHPTLDHVTKEITKSLGKHGISHRWEVEQPNGIIRVICILTHEAGHSERTSIEGPADNSGSKNAIQSIGAAVTYLERYTLLAATGIAAKDQDNDASTMEDLSEQLEWITNAGSREELEKLFKQAYQKAHAAKDQKAMLAIIAAKDRKKKELAA